MNLKLALEPAGWCSGGKRGSGWNACFVLPNYTPKQRRMFNRTAA